MSTISSVTTGASVRNHPDWRRDDGVRMRPGSLFATKIGPSQGWAPKIGPKRTHTITEVGMTRTDDVASSRPHWEVADGETARERRGASRRLAALPLALLLTAGLALPSAALAAEGLTGYSTTPKTETTTTPKTTTTTTTTPTTPTTTTTPKGGTSPSKEETEPSKPTTSTSGVAANAESTSTTSKASTLPFTGFDLRWSIAVGVALMAAGCALLAVYRRDRRGGR
jgi:cobalamin biosynthesis Mg chelatase CobN